MESWLYVGAGMTRGFELDMARSGCMSLASQLGEDHTAAVRYLGKQHFVCPKEGLLGVFVEAPC